MSTQSFVAMMPHEMMELHTRAVLGLPVLLAHHTGGGLAAWVRANRRMDSDQIAIH